METTQGNFGILEPIGGGDSIHLLKDRLVVGRRQSSDICLPFANVSSNHCELILEQGYWKVRDLQSTNGVKVNGERVLEKRVYPGDELSISKHRFRLEYTPTTARSADSEVDELHEDIMRFSLLERAGLTKQGEKTRETARRQVKGKSEEDIALDYLNITAAKSESSRSGEDAAASPSKSSVSLGEEVLEVVSPAAPARELSEDDFLNIISEDGQKKKEKKEPNQGAK